MLITIDRQNPSRTIQEQIYEGLRTEVRSGRLRPGARVLSSRLLADQLAVSRNSVIFAYERLIDEGFLAARPMVGTFVADTLPDQAVETPDLDPTRGDPDRWPDPAFSGRRHALLNTSSIPIDFWTQRTDPRAFPLKAWRRLILQSLSKAGHNLTEYGDPCGLMSLREAIADHVGRSRGIRTNPEQIIIVAGAQLGLNLVLRLLARDGDEIVVENPCNQGAAYLFESSRLRLRPLPVDVHGLDPSGLAGPARLIYLTPSHQFPMGSTLSLARRHAILNWADTAGSYVIEDDYDTEFRYDSAPVPALKALRPDSVIYLSTFSKSLGAGLRTGFAIFPEHLTAGAATAKALLDNGQVWLEQAALSRFIADGGFARHLRRLRRLFMTRRDVLLAELHARFGPSEIWGSEAGTHIGWRLPDALPRAPALAARARTRNIGLYTVQSGGGHEYDTVSYGENWLLLGYASLSDAQIRAGIARLAESV